jgi:hypothetical protein
MDESWAFRRATTRARSTRRSNPIVESLGQRRLLAVRRAAFRVRPNFGAAVAANRTDEQVLQIGQPQALGPAVSVDHNRMPTFAVAAEHPQPVRAGLPHLSEGDFLLTWHGRILPKITPRSEYAIWHRFTGRQASIPELPVDHRVGASAAGTRMARSNAINLLGIFVSWLGNLDSNQDKQSQSLLCYRYTIPQ